MTDSTPPASRVRSRSGHPAPPEPVAATCPACSYDLTGLRDTADCPECGFSVSGRDLARSSPAYLHGVSRGLHTVVVAGGILYVLGTLGAIGGSALTVRQMMKTFQTPGLFTPGGPTAPPTAELPAFMTAGVFSPFGILQIVVYFVSLTLAILIARGWWLATTRDESRPESDRSDSNCQLIRIASIVIVVMTAANLGGLVHAGAGPGGISVPVSLALAAPSFLLMAAMAARFFGTTLHLRWLAGRIPDEPLVGTTRLFIWLLPVIAILGACALGLGIVVAQGLNWWMILRVSRAVRGVTPAASEPA